MGKIDICNESNDMPLTLQDFVSKWKGAPAPRRGSLRRYCWKSDLSDEEILEKLLELNFQRAKQE